MAYADDLLLSSHMPFLLYVRPLSVFNLIHYNTKLIVEVFFFNSDSIYIRNQLFVFRFAFMKVHIL